MMKGKYNIKHVTLPHCYSPKFKSKAKVYFGLYACELCLLQVPDMFVSLLPDLLTQPLTEPGVAQMVHLTSL